jgi:hypothetical protein
MSYYQVLAHSAVDDLEEGKQRPERARHPKSGAKKPGTFVADDPSTPDVNEAFTDG